MRVEDIPFNFSGGIRRFGTDCCALGQLSVGNNNSIEEIQNALKKIRAESSETWYGKSKDGGDRAIFVITTPSEKSLAKNLSKIGFKMVSEFPRRNGYPEGMLKMWIIVL
jgi:hypothetical protein